MNLNSLLERLTEKGVHLAVDGDRVKVRAERARSHDSWREVLQSGRPSGR